MQQDVTVRVSLSHGQKSSAKLKADCQGQNAGEYTKLLQD